MATNSPIGTLRRRLLMPNSITARPRSPGTWPITASRRTTPSPFACRIRCRGLKVALRLHAPAPNLATIIATDRGTAAAPALRYAELLQTEPKAKPRDPASLHETAFILYTSGTTGRAKGVRLTVHGMLWVTAASWAPIAGFSASDTLLSPLPLFHSYALNLSVLSVLATGASAHIMERFSTAEALRLLKSGEFTFFAGVPTMFHYLLQATHSDERVKLDNLRLCVSAGAIMPATLNREFEEKFAVQLLDGYGITETSTMVIMNWPSGNRVPGSCGIPLPGLAVRIVDANGNDVDATG